MSYDGPVYYILNKKEDFEKGYTKNIEVTDAGISVKKEVYGTGIFISDFYDSYEMRNVWNRLIIEKSGGNIIKLTYYASDDISELKDALNNEELSYEEINVLMEPYKVKTVVNAFDILLHDAVGQYFWLKVEILNLRENNSIIHSIKIEFPIQSYLKYIPEIYQSDEESKRFLEGYLGIFQSLYTDLEKKIDKCSAYFDPDVTNQEFLEWLCKWVKIENSYIWKEEKLRYLLKNITKFYERTGTPKGISDIVELYADEKPYIIEYFNLRKFMKYKEQYEILSKLYSDNPYEFTIILSEQSIPSEKEYKEVAKLIDEFKPAHTEAKIVILKPYIFLGNYSYLGINTYLNSDRNMVLDGLATLPFTKLDN